MLAKTPPLSTSSLSMPGHSANRAFDWKRIVRAVSLFIGLAGGIVVFILAWPDRFWLRSTSLLLACFYIFWGTLTHNKAGTFSMKIFWEYAGIACLGALMLWLIV